MEKAFSAPRGTADILPDQIAFWRALEGAARALLACYGYKEIRTPVFEETELFARSAGETSDIVQKQMLNLAPQSASSTAAESSILSLRPEGTASIVRAYIEHRFDRKEALSKLFYIGPMFRGERPQKGRLRQFHQIGVEAIGVSSASPFLDAEVIGLCIAMLEAFGLKEFSLKLNTLGTQEDKERLASFLREQVRERLDHFCPDCRNRHERNVFRILDCKNPECREQVKQLKISRDILSGPSLKYFEAVKIALDRLGIAYVEDPYMVRGLDYYTHTVFELSCPGLGSQDAVGAGGRYDKLVHELGGPDADAVGFALGMERILLALNGKAVGEEPGPDVYLIALGDAAVLKAFELLQALRGQGVLADMSFFGGSLKSQMRQAGKAASRYVIIAGENELARNCVILKNMAEGTQTEVVLDNVGRIVKIVKNNA